MALVVIQLLFEFRNTNDLVLNGGVAGDALLLLEFLQEFVDVASARLEDLLGSVEHRAFSFDFVEGFHHRLVLRIFLAKIGCILPEVIALHVLSALRLHVVLFLLLHGLLEGHLFHFKLLQLFRLLVLLLAYSVGLASIDG